MSINEEENSKIKELIEHFANASKNKDFINGQNEEWVKWNYLEPLFESLGWKRSEIVKEQRVLKGRADYILKIGNEEVLVIEAKKVGVNLTEEEGRQAVSYAYHRKIKFAVLTNFKEIRVYHALSNIKNIDKNILKFDDGALFRLSFDQLLNNIDKLNLLSRESFEKQEIHKLLSKKDEKTAKPIDQSILSDLLHIRELLSKDLKKLRMQLSQQQIDEAVQVLINRLIFMRSVEDRGLENANFLLGLVKDFNEGRLRKRLWDELIEQFKTFDKTYNSKLFAHSILEDENIFFDDESITKSIRILYFGSQDIQARYMFDEIPGDLLGSIYEQYLGTVLQETEKRVKLDSDSGKRKKMGIYYTPSYIVDYIVKNTVGEYIKNKTIDEILEVNIVDPACGSGSFLLKAFQEVCNTIEERLKKGEKAKSSTFTFYNDNRLSLSQKISILTNCIYGVDLDEKAVELAQLNLLLKLLEDESKTAHKHILPNLRENIKCGNSLIDDPKVAGDKAFNWHAQFPEPFHKGGFDVVVGNPPYGANLTKKEQDYYKKLYDIGSTDTAILFLKQSINHLKDKGNLGFIIPKAFTFASNYQRIRNYAWENIKSIIDASKVWKSVKLEQAILVLNKGKKLEKYSSGVVENNLIIQKDDMDKKLAEIFQFLPTDLSKEEIKIGMKINNIGSFLSEHVDNKRGVILNKFVKGGKYPVIGGKEIDRYRIRNIRGYINENLKNTNAEIQNNSLLVQGIVAHIENPSDHIKITATIPNSNIYFIADNINQIIVKKDLSKIILWTILNSNLCNWYCYRFIYAKSIRTMRFDNPITNRIPIPKEITKNQEAYIINLANQMISLQKQLHEGKPSGNEKERLEQQIKNIDYEIDQEVYKLYGLTNEEIKIVEDSLK